MLVSSDFNWKHLQRPIFALAPMDGVTDSAFRSLLYRKGPADVAFTEFVSAEGLARRIPRLFEELRFEPNEGPIIAQIYGYEIEAFRACVPILSTLGFDGIDINMGCPSKNVVHHGGGAALIRTCPHAKAIIQTCVDALKENYEETGRKIPLSVKTRLGHDQVSLKDWIGPLLECEGLENLSIHGRTLKQKYSGYADWDAIASAAELAKGSGISILGNGDIESLEDAIEKISASGVDGALIGRATFGNPWFFREKEFYRSACQNKIARNQENQKDLRDQIEFTQNTIEPSQKSVSVLEKIETLIEHATLLSERKDVRQFIQIRKHIGWYLKSFSNASMLRTELMKVKNLEELKDKIAVFKKRTNDSEFKEAN